jgi:hypothetical protein
MFKISLNLCFLLLLSSTVSAQIDSKQIKSKVKAKVETTITANTIANTSILSVEDTIKGLKEALMQGVGFSVGKLGVIDGFLNDPNLKILLPSDAKRAEERLRKLGLDDEIDRAIMAMNRGAENAVATSTEILKQAILNLTIQNALNIVMGEQDAATQYLKKSCLDTLTSKMKPVVTESLNQVGATKYWSAVVKPYNLLSKQKINPDLSAHVTEKALEGLFSLIAAEELRIRKDPGARSSEILQNIFGSH